MGLRIKTNVAAVNAQRQLFNATTSVGKTMEKISSGLRINRSGDDAAGLAISEQLKSDIRALGQAGRNAADGISLVQTAEGALDEVSNILIRMKELSVQARTGTLGDDERSFLNAEYNGLRDEITRISNSSNFNGVGLLNGTGGLLNVQVGIGTTSANQVVLDLTNDLDINGLSLTASILSWGSAGTALAEIDLAAHQVLEVRGSFGAVQNRLETSVRNIAVSAENLAAANSRIRDADIAQLTATLTGQQVLQQAGVSILTQANMSSQLALSLMQG
jgi:flagellin